MGHPGPCPTQTQYCHHQGRKQCFSISPCRLSWKEEDIVLQLRIALNFYVDFVCVCVCVLVIQLYLTL